MKFIMSDLPINLEKCIDKSIEYVDLSQLTIRNCMGCFGCWLKTPGKCIIRDDATKVSPMISDCNHMMIVSKVKYGSYDVVMKRMLERAIPIQQAFLRIHNGEIHHVPRRVMEKNAVIIAYGISDDEEKSVFQQLVERNKHNMIFSQVKVIFVDEQEVQSAVEREVQQWKSC